MSSNKNKFNSVMLDLETMGSMSHSAIVSIGAVRFDIKTGEIGEKFYINVDLQSCLDAGLIINADTLMWWLNQSDAARKKISEKGIPLQKALLSLAIFMNKDYEVWGNSARFDLGILSDAFNTFGIPIPWDFRKERCVRTLVSFAPEIKDAEVNTGVAHDALADCIFQINYCSKIFNKLK
jgi:DNA polymerase III epsilon subunit-like protein